MGFFDSPFRVFSNLETESDTWGFQSAAKGAVGVHEGEVDPVRHLVRERVRARAARLKSTKGVVLSLVVVVVVVVVVSTPELPYSRSLSLSLSLASLRVVADAYSKTRRKKK